MNPAKAEDRCCVSRASPLSSAHAWWINAAIAPLSLSPRMDSSAICMIGPWERQVQYRQKCPMMPMHSHALAAALFHREESHPSSPRGGDSPDCDIECVAAPLDMGYSARIDLR